MEKNLQYLRQLIGVCYCANFYQGITSDLKVKKITIIIIIIIMMMIMIIKNIPNTRKY